MTSDNITSQGCTNLASGRHTSKFLLKFSFLVLIYCPALDTMKAMFFVDYLKDSNLIIFLYFYIIRIHPKAKEPDFPNRCKKYYFGIICQLKESQSGNIKRNKIPPSMRRTAITETNDCFSFKKILEMYVHCSVIFVQQ